MSDANTLLPRRVELILPLSLAIDLGTGAPAESFLASALFAVHLGEKLALDENALADTYYLALLRFVGCTADAHLSATAFGDEIEFSRLAGSTDYSNPSQIMRLLWQSLGMTHAPLERVQMLINSLGIFMRESHELAAGHCEVAQMIATGLGMNASVVDGLGKAFERWDGKGQLYHTKGEAIPLPVRIVQVTHSAGSLYTIGGVEMAVKMVREWAGGAFDPAIVECFAENAQELFQSIQVESLWDATLDAEPGVRPCVSDMELEQGLGIIANFADLKFPYTTGHSSGVARLARAAAQEYGLPAADALTLKRAALVHDVGRVGVSAAIWNKPGALSELEWERVRLHPYYTERVFARSRPLAPLGALGALNHERLDGSGYHRNLRAPMLSPAARVLAAADVYHSLTESRPHRPAFAPELAAQEIKRQVRAGRLDSDAVNAVLEAAGQHTTPVRRERLADLTDREIEVLRLVARGLTNREIGQKLGITSKTAGNHLQNIYSKLSVSTRAAATFFAMQHHLV